jgi:hypothetical protein
MIDQEGGDDVLSISLLAPMMVLWAVAAADPATSRAELISRLTPQPQRLSLEGGPFALRGASLTIAAPEGPQHEACRAVLEETLRAAGATVHTQPAARRDENRFSVGSSCAAPPLPTEGQRQDAYVPSVGPTGVAAAAASPAGLLYAAQTLRQLARIFSEEGRLPGLTVVDYPEFRTRGYDVLGISAMYNHTFYLADLSPGAPRKLWSPMEQTGTRNITGMVQEAALISKDSHRPEFWGSVTASFSKHRLRAFDSIWYGFVLNGHCTWSHPRRSIEEEQDDFTRAFVAHYHDCRTRASADALAAAWKRLDACKSQLELANQSLHNVVGVYDTQEPGYQGNTLLEALRRCRKLAAGSKSDQAGLETIGNNAIKVQSEEHRARDALEAQRRFLGRTSELDDLLLAGEKISAHAEREVLMIDTQTFLNRASLMPPTKIATVAAEAVKRWRQHRLRVEAIASRDARLDRRDDPCGHQSELRDIAVVEAHLDGLARGRTDGSRGATLLDEPFATLDLTRWLVLGHPRVAGGCLETTAPGGWDKRCGIATRDAFALEADRPLVVEFRLTPIKMAVDSQLFESATEHGTDSFRFSFYGPRDRFGVYTQSERVLSGPWLDTSPGWRPRVQSGPVEQGKEYRIRAEIRRGSFRVVVRAADESVMDVPFWDSGEVPMDPLNETRLGFVDVEPPGSTARSRWGAIVIQK